MKKNFFSARVGWLILSMIVFGVVILLRLIEIQLFRGQDFIDLADNNRYSTLNLPVERGVFLDRYQQPLVWNKRTYERILDPGVGHSVTQPLEKEEALRLLATDSAQVRSGLQRYYRFPESTAHVLGYVGPVTKENLINDSSLKVYDVIGKMGLERAFDEQLRGQAGSEVYEINALGKRQRLISKTTGQAGKNIQTTLDPQLSQVAWQALGEQIGAVVIMSADNGEVLSLVSSPSFDANVLSTRFSDPILEKQRQQQVQILFNNPLQIFFNRSLSGAYPPGSVFKLVTALGGLEDSAVNADTTVVDKGVLKVGEYTYANWYYTQYGRTEGKIKLRRALARSNDIFFYKVAEWLGPNKLAEFARLFGFGEKTGIELGGEVMGLVPDPAWKERAIGEPWYLGNTFHMGIGQGDMLVTPLQVAQMTQAIAHHGTLCRPTLLPSQPSGCIELGIKEDNLKLVLAGMLDACSRGGTAYPFFGYNQRHRGEVEGEKTVGEEVAGRETTGRSTAAGAGSSVQDQINQGAIACKTGTAEFGGVDKQGYRRTHGWLTLIMGTDEIARLAEAAGAGKEERVGGSEAANENEAGSEVSNETGNEASNEVKTSPQNYQKWLAKVKEYSLPERIVITVLVESDDENHLKEGSADAGKVAKEIVEWMYENW